MDNKNEGTPNWFDYLLVVLSILMIIIFVVLKCTG